MKKSLLIISAAVVFSAGNVFSETHYVLPGDRIQTVVDQAEDGDTVVMLGGEYPYDVSITKNIKFKKILGEAVEINGDLTVSGLTEPFEINGIMLRGDTDNNDAATFSNCIKVTLENLPTGTRHIAFQSVETVVVSKSKGSFNCKDSKTVSLTAIDQSDSTKGVHLERCADVYMSNFSDLGHTGILDCAEVNISNGSLHTFHLGQCKSTINKVTMINLTLAGDNNSCVMVKCATRDGVHIVDGTDDKPYIFFQNTIGHTISSDNNIFDLTLGYNMLRGLNLNHRGVLKMVGNMVDGFYLGPDTDPFPRHSHYLESYVGVLLHWNMHDSADSILYAYNNVFKNCRDKNDNHGQNMSGIRLANTTNATIKIYNNVIGNIYDEFAENKWDRGRGIAINKVPALMEIKGNIFYDINGGRGTGSYPVHAPFDNVKVHNNYSANCGPWDKGGYRGFNNITGSIADDFVDFGKVDLPGNWNLSKNHFYSTVDTRLKDGSKCINAGPEEPWHFDRDGTRNDIGLYGGSNYDPDGFTTEKPVILFSEQEPLQFIKGNNEAIYISADGIVAP